MTASTAHTRKPHVVDADDPSVEFVTGDDTDLDLHPVPNDADAPLDTGPTSTGSPLKSGFRWGAILIAAMVALATLAASLSFASFITHVLARDDWIGWLGFAIAGIAALACAGLVIREGLGLIRLSRLTRLRTAITKTLRDKDIGRERELVHRLQGLYAERNDLKWSLARLKDHQGDVRDAGELLRLTDRELMTPLDTQARALILKSAKRVTVGTAISPMVWISMLYVVAENLRLIKGLATLYGARPGGIGALRLARLVFTHILATGGLAMTDDLLGQFLGQDLVRRLSRRLGEGVFNGALTARVGTAAVAVTRPLPFLDAEPLRLRDIMRTLVRNTTKSKAP